MILTELARTIAKVKLSPLPRLRKLTQKIIKIARCRRFQNFFHPIQSFLYYKIFLQTQGVDLKIIYRLSFILRYHRFTFSLFLKIISIFYFISFLIFLRSHEEISSRKRERHTHTEENIARWSGSTWNPARALRLSIHCSFQLLLQISST